MMPEHLHRLHLINEVATHLLSIVVVTGFLGLAYISVLGFVDLSNPTVSGFLGTLIGAVGAKVEPVMANYFGRVAQIRADVKEAENVNRNG